jgi:hypothetical protein
MSEKEQGQTSADNTFIRLTPEQEARRQAIIAELQVWCPRFLVDG